MKTAASDDAAVFDRQNEIDQRKGNRREVLSLSYPYSSYEFGTSSALSPVLGPNLLRSMDMLRTGGCLGFLYRGFPVYLSADRAQHRSVTSQLLFGEYGAA